MTTLSCVMLLYHVVRIPFLNYFQLLCNVFINLQAVGTMEQVFFEHTNRHTFASSCYDIVLKPAVKLQNCLPVPILVSQLGLRRTQVFSPGEMFHLSHLAPNKASIVIMVNNNLFIK